MNDALRLVKRCFLKLISVAIKPNCKKLHLGLLDDYPTPAPCKYTAKNILINILTKILIILHQK